MQYWQRRLFWAWLLSGGSANYGGRWWAVEPYSETGTRASTYYNRAENTFRTQLTGLDSVRPIRDFFEQRAIDLGDFEPAHGLAQASVRSEARSPRVMRRAKQEFLIYYPHAAADDQAAQVDTRSAAELRFELRDADGKFSVESYRPRPVSKPMPKLPPRRLGEP